MQKFELVITNPDGTPYWREGFDKKIDLNTWLNEEKTRPYWQKDFKVEIIDNTDALKAQEDAWKAAQKADDDAKKAARAELKALRNKKTKTLADAVALLEKIIDYLGAAKD